MPDSRERSRPQPGRSTLGGSMVTSRSGAANPDRMPGMREPMALPATVRGRLRNISRARHHAADLAGSRVRTEPDGLAQSATSQCERRACR